MTHKSDPENDILFGALRVTEAIIAVLKDVVRHVFTQRI